MSSIIETDILDMFGLTPRQSLLMFSTEKIVATHDAILSSEKRNFKDKMMWIKEWEESLLTYLRTFSGYENAKLLTKEELKKEYEEELSKSPNHTWYYIAALECLEFTPYTPLGDKDKDKKYRKLKYNEKACDAMLQDFYIRQGYLSKEKIERIYYTYDKSIGTISGKGKSITIRVLVVLGVTALCALIAALGAPEIAIAIFGKQLEFSGAALASACLALAGGGAVAAGGLGMAGGVAIIAGGGALLGLAAGSGGVAVASMTVLKAPDFTLTQAAKLETILKEVILNSQKDIVTAQTLIEKYQNKIIELCSEVEKLELQAETNKKELKRIKESLKYMKKSCKDMSVFTSSYEIGTNATA